MVQPENNIHIFYHVYQYGQWESMYLQQIHALYVSGLLKETTKLHIGVVGNIPLFYVPDNAEVTYHPENREEADTLKMVRDFSLLNIDAQIMYFHTKGVSRQTVYTESWRLFLEYFTIFKWKENIEYLKSYDCVGTNWDVLTFYGNTHHFSGGFWWANASYINTLDHSYLENDIRVFREFWIGSNYVKNNPKVKEIFNTGLNNFDLARHYYEIYPETKYVN